MFINPIRLILGLCTFFRTFRCRASSALQRLLLDPEGPGHYPICIFWGIFKMISRSFYVFFFTWGNTSLWAPPAPWRSLIWSLLDRKSSFPSGSAVKNLPVMQHMRVWSLRQKEALEKGMATNSSILAWKIPWTEELGGLQSIGSQRVRHNWSDSMHAARKSWHLGTNQMPMTSETDWPSARVLSDTYSQRMAEGGAYWRKSLLQSLYIKSAIFNLCEQLKTLL